MSSFRLAVILALSAILTTVALEPTLPGYVLMVQRSNVPNSDASDVGRDFQQAAAHALAKR